MADPTDRQRAEAKALELLAPVAEMAAMPFRLTPFITAAADALLSFRSEGWEAGREAAAKWHDDLAEYYDEDARAYKADEMDARPSERSAKMHRKFAAAIRALPTPKEK